MITKAILKKAVEMLTDVKTKPRPDLELVARNLRVDIDELWQSLRHFGFFRNGRFVNDVRI